MARKSVVGSAGRYGPRYGKRIRAKVSDIESLQRKKHVCPSCDLPYVKRQSAGIWVCRKCGAKFAGSSYYPKSQTTIKKEKVLAE
jgi:large subunit ribosomal protein L37Ae